MVVIIPSAHLARVIYGSGTLRLRLQLARRLAAGSTKETGNKAWCDRGAMMLSCLVASGRKTSTAGRNCLPARASTAGAWKLEAFRGWRGIFETNSPPRIPNAGHPLLASSLHACCPRPSLPHRQPADKTTHQLDNTHIVESERRWHDMSVHSNRRTTNALSPGSSLLARASRNKNRRFVSLACPALQIERPELESEPTTPSTPA